MSIPVNLITYLNVSSFNIATRDGSMSVKSKADAKRGTGPPFRNVTITGVPEGQLGIQYDIRCVVDHTYVFRVDVFTVFSSVCVQTFIYSI